MNSNVVPLKSAALAAIRAEHSFLACACGDEVNGFAPVMIHDAAGAFICSLVCVSCGTETPIVNGRIKE
jgi:hypothetical protein